MKNSNFKRTILVLAVLVFGFFTQNSIGQVFTNKEVGKKNQQVIDSLKTAEYPYSLPIWGKKTTQKGYKLPYSAGLSVNYMYQQSDLIIENLKVGFNNGPMYDIDEIVRFNSAVSTSNGVNIRPDVWLFPFLNVYGIFAKTDLSTAIGAGVYIPNQDGEWTDIMDFNTEANFQGTTAGIGFTPTIGVGGGWFALDMNVSWTDVPALDEPAMAFVLGPRFGKTFKLKNQDQNINVWTGAFRLHINSGTSGSLLLSELISTDELQTKVDNGIIKVEDTQVQVDDWWNGLTNLQQNNPINIAKYETANRALETAGGFLNSIDSALNDEESASVQYSLDKRPADMWNFLLGTQYQHNKHWMVRCEVGFLGSRTQVLAGLQYRFGL